MTNTRDIIIKLKEVREEKGLSYADILNILEEKGQYPISKSTISRVFGEGSEELSFKYEETIRPLANALLDIENIEADDALDVQAMKLLLKFKIDKIEELENQIERLETTIDQSKLKYHEKMEKERASFQRSLEFLKEQISLKDKRMDQLLEAVFKKDEQHKVLLDLILSCPARSCKKGE